MAYDVVLAVWCGLSGVSAAVWAGRYAVRGPWRRRAVARVLHVWEPTPGAGWDKGVPADVGYTDPDTGREMVGATRAGGGRVGRLEAAWPGREVVAFARLRRPEDFRVLDRPPRPVDAFLFGAGASLFLAAAPPVARALFGRDSLGWALGAGAGAVLLAFLAIVAGGTTVSARRRRAALLAAPERTTGHVVDVKERRDPAAEIRAGKLLTPVVAFTTGDGLPVTAVCAYTSATDGLRPGDPVVLRYARGDPSVFTIEGALPAAARRHVATGQGPGMSRVWIQAEGARIRADRVTAVLLTDDGLLLRTLDHGQAIALDPGSREAIDGTGAAFSADPAERRSRFDRLADELLGRIEESPAREGGSLIVFRAADGHHAAGFTVLALPGPERVVPGRELPVQDRIPPSYAASLPGAPSPATDSASASTSTPASASAHPAPGRVRLTKPGPSPESDSIG